MIFEIISLLLFLFLTFVTFAKIFNKVVIGWTRCNFDAQVPFIILDICVEAHEGASRVFKFVAVIVAPVFAVQLAVAIIRQVCCM